MVHVRHHDLQLVVRVHPGDQAALQHFRAFADDFLKMFEAFRGVSVHAYEDEGGEAQAELLAVQQGYLADDVAVVLELLDPSRTGRWRQAYPFCQFLVGDACVALEFFEDTQVVAVEFVHGEDFFQVDCHRQGEFE